MSGKEKLYTVHITFTSRIAAEIYADSPEDAVRKVDLDVCDYFPDYEREIRGEYAYEVEENPAD